MKTPGIALATAIMLGAVSATAFPSMPDITTSDGASPVEQRVSELNAKMNAVAFIASHHCDKNPGVCVLPVDDLAPWSPETREISEDPNGQAEAIWRGARYSFIRIASLCRTRESLCDMGDYSGFGTPPPLTARHDIPDGHILHRLDWAEEMIDFSYEGGRFLCSEYVDNCGLGE